jgi:hypothetical protein
MNRGTAGLAALALTAIGLTAAPAAAAATSAGSTAPRADESVIVVLRHQYSFPGTPAGSRERVRAARAAQAPVLARLRAGHATDITQLPLIDAVAATVSPAQAQALAGQAGVAAVVPNAAFRGPDPVRVNPGRASALTPGVCPARGQVQLNPEGVELVHAVSASPGVGTARKLGFTGAGVTVGDIAVGIDPAEPEMIRPDGQHVIAVYKDFTGEGTAVQGPEDLESYLDDSVMAAQGRLVYDLHDQNKALPKGCDIRLQGVAPGITLDAYKVYGDEDMTTTSAFLGAINYAVDTDHVNVLNEEGGSFPMPDTSQDLIKMANDAAMAAGVTITSPSYDAGPESTIWSPSSQPGVISVGASTGFRSYAQADVGEYARMRAQGWVSDNISSLSSGGSTEGGRSIDVVAPGDLDWVACGGDPAACGGENLVLSGGTSESGPVTAAVAALVIQAYRSTHRGTNPSAGLVRDIISSSATDLGLPGSLQGSGLVNAYRAVKAALAAPGATSKGGTAGPALVASTQQLASIGQPGAPVRLSFRLTNEGSKTASVRLASRTTARRPSFTYSRTIRWAGSLKDDIFRFTLPHAAALLTADIASPDPVGVPQISLVNPHGQFTAYSLPQGLGDHGQVEVRQAAAGSWEMDVSGVGDYHGPVYVQVTATPMGSFGQVSPDRVRLAPGASTTVTLAARYPAAPGDRSGSVTFSAPGWGASSLPVTLRSLVPLTGGTGHFLATLVGGNGRGGVPAQTFFYNFDVPAGQRAVDVQARLAGSNNDPFFAYLIDPQGEAVAQASNQVLIRDPSTGPVVTGEPGARLHTLAPPAGRWTVIITFTNPVNGNALDTPLSGTISLTPVTATAPGLPHSPKTTIARGSEQVVPVTIRNNGDAAEAYFLDGRLDQATTLPLTSITPSAGLKLPLNDTASIPQWIVPTDTTSVTATAVSSAPTTFDTSPWNGEPDIGATVHGDQASATMTAPGASFLTQGDWDIVPQQVGPFGSSGAAPSTTTVRLAARTAAFDPGLTSDTGDLWAQGAAAQASFAPVLVQPGQTTTLYAVIAPTAKAGTVVHGTLYVDDASELTNEGESPSGDQLVALPYTYTIG